MMLRIAHVTGSKNGTVEEFERESVLIGRGAQNDLAFDPFGDAVVSSQHAEIRREDDRYVLYDMGSLNGTFLNGCPVKRAALNSGDEIGLGRRGPRLLFDVDRERLARRRPSAMPLEIPKNLDAELRSTQREFAIPAYIDRVAGRRPHAMASQRLWFVLALLGALAIIGSIAYGLWLR
jgi:pSer/pThr/pTyr-binding forkhead associated (FHA) protein